MLASTIHCPGLTATPAEADTTCPGATAQACWTAMCRCRGLVAQPLCLTPFLSLPKMSRAKLKDPCPLTDGDPPVIIAATNTLHPPPGVRRKNGTAATDTRHQWALQILIARRPRTLKQLPFLAQVLLGKRPCTEPNRRQEKPGKATGRLVVWPFFGNQRVVELPEYWVLWLFLVKKILNLFWSIFQKNGQFWLKQAFLLTTFLGARCSDLLPFRWVFSTKSLSFFSQTLQR